MMGSRAIPRTAGKPSLEKSEQKGSPRCRFCHSRLRHAFVDLGMAPLSQSILNPEQLNHTEPFYPLHVHVCENCFLVQLEEYVSPVEIFTEYAYFSSYSDTWLEHAKAYVEMAVERFGLDGNSQVVEIGSNDGYLLQYFAMRQVNILGIEPAANVAEVAIRKGIPTVIRFFGERLARELSSQGKQADLLTGNNVLAHVPDLNGFVKGLKFLLKPQGVITMEFPHLMRLIEGNQFDTIYHEHFSYFSFFTVTKVLAAHGLTIFDVEELPTHGGSLRIYARHAECESHRVSARVKTLKAQEEAAGFTRLEGYLSFEEKVRETKRQLLDFLIRVKREGKSVVGGKFLFMSMSARTVSWFSWRSTSAP